MAGRATDLAVVFPRAGVTGGVERVALQFLEHQAGRRRTAFVGLTCSATGIRHDVVRPARTPPALAPLTFRAAAARTLRRSDAAMTVSFGVECPPGDVYWVHSVHRAWLRDGGELTVRGRRIPAAARRLLPRHQVLLQLERDYFTRHRPRLILCTSQREADDLVELYDVDRELLQVVPNGVDGMSLNPARRDALRPAARAAFGATPDDVVVLMVANEWHRKGLGVLLEAVAATGDRRLRVDLVGRRDPVDYQTAAERLGVRMRWHGPAEDVAHAYAAADVFALPTTYEPFGTVIVEAMATGLPVIVPRLAGASAAVTDGLDGTLLEDPRDVDELMTALTRLMHPAERDRLRSAAAAAARPYEWGTVLDRVDALIFGPSWPSSGGVLGGPVG